MVQPICVVCANEFPIGKQQKACNTSDFCRGHVCLYFQQQSQRGNAVDYPAAARQLPAALLLWVAGSCLHRCPCASAPLPLQLPAALLLWAAGRCLHRCPRASAPLPLQLPAALLLWVADSCPSRCPRASAPLPLQLPAALLLWAPGRCLPRCPCSSAPLLLQLPATLLLWAVLQGTTLGYRIHLQSRSMEFRLEARKYAAWAGEYSLLESWESRALSELGMRALYSCIEMTLGGQLARRAP